MFSAWLGYYVDVNLRINCSPALAERVFAMNKPYRGDDNEEWNRLIKSNKVLMTGIDLTRTRDQEHQLQRHFFSLSSHPHLSVSLGLCVLCARCNAIVTVRGHCLLYFSLIQMFRYSLNSRIQKKHKTLRSNFAQFQSSGNYCENSHLYLSIITLEMIYSIRLKQLTWWRSWLSFDKFVRTGKWTKFC